MIYIHGYYGYSNCGDEAFKCVFSKYLKDFEYKFTSPNNPPPENPGKNDLLILGGGNVIDPYFLNPIKNWSDRIIVVGVGLSSKDGLELLLSLKPKTCFIRNKSELDIIKAFLPNAQYTPDIVFSLTSSDLLNSKIGIEKPGTSSRLAKRPGFEKDAAIILSDRLTSFLNVDKYSEGIEYLNAINNLIIFLKFLAKFYNLHFLAFSNDFYHPDSALNELIASNLLGFNDRVSFTVSGNHPAKAFEVISSVDVVFSMKFHSLVFALIANKPVINLSDAPKCLSLMNELKLDNLSHSMCFGAGGNNLKNSLQFVESGNFSASDFVSDAHLNADKVMNIVVDKIRASLGGN
jgi:polysaccharide pyruvyl transferase WcaK-like protein